MASTMLFTDSRGRVLVVDPTYKPLFELPGGVVEAGESPWCAARREIAEELGLDQEPGRLLAVDYVPARGDRTEGLIVVFDGGTLDPRFTPRLPPDELRGFAFVEPSRLGAYLPELQTRRAHAALAALDGGYTDYLHDGRSVRTPPDVAPATPTALSAPREDPEQSAD